MEAALPVGFDRCPRAVGAIDVDKRVLVWANDELRTSLGCTEWPDLDIARLVPASEYELERRRFDQFVTEPSSYSWVRTLMFGGEWVTVRSWLWPIGTWSPKARDARLAGVMSEVFLPAKGQPLAEWLDTWPQPCALVHRSAGLQHLNTRFRALLGLAPGPLSESTRAELRAIALRSGTNRLYEDGGPNGNVDGTVDDRPAIVRVEPFGRLPVPVLVTRVPVPRGADPDLFVIVGHTLGHDADELAKWSSTLSPRECDIARLLLDGHRVATIAESLGRSPHTIRNHLRSMFVKTRTSSQAELLACLRGDE